MRERNDCLLSPAFTALFPYCSSLFLSFPFFCLLGCACAHSQLPHLQRVLVLLPQVHHHWVRIPDHHSPLLPPGFFCVAVLSWWVLALLLPPALTFSSPCLGPRSLFPPTDPIPWLGTNTKLPVVPVSTLISPPALPTLPLWEPPNSSLVLTAPSMRLVLPSPRGPLSPLAEDFLRCCLSPTTRLRP